MAYRQLHVFAAAITLSLVCVTPGVAGGLYIWDFGQPTMGAAGAGAGAIAEDASTALFNPAGVMFLDKPQSLATGMVIDVSAKFRQDSATSTGLTAVARADGTRPASNGGDAGSRPLAGAYFYARPVDDKWGWGFSLASISGAALEYKEPQDFAGRYWADEVELLTITAAPSVSYRINDELSVGFAMSIMFGSLDMDVSIPNAAALAPDGVAAINNGEDIQASFSLSAMWQPQADTRIGVTYFYENEVKFDSDLRITLPAGVPPVEITGDVEFTFPQTLRTWLAHDLNEDLTLLATVAWEDWSAMDSILVSTQGGAGALDRDWDDVWHVGLGLRGKLSGPWTWYTGVAYDSDPTEAANRTVDMPVDRQIRLSGGVTYQRENGHQVGTALTWVDMGDAAIDNGGNRPVSDLPWTVKGDYSTNRMILLGINYTW